MTDNIILNTAFVFMACDGDIAPQEIALIRQMNGQIGKFTINDIDGALESLVEELNASGKDLLKQYLASVDNADLDRDAALSVLRTAVAVIYADTEVVYPEVKFFRTVRSRIRNITDDDILANIPGVDDFWLEADAAASIDAIERDYFDNTEIPHFDTDTIKAPAANGQ